MIDEKLLKKKFKVVGGLLDERSKRIWAACEAKSLGRGGIAAVARATGLSRTTITLGTKEVTGLERGKKLDETRVRKHGAGRKGITEEDPRLLRDLKALIEPTTRGDPQSPLLWTCKSTRNLADELNRRRHRVGHSKVAMLLHQEGYSLQGNRKTQEGNQHPDRNAQFEYINRRTRLFQSRSWPVISVDTKKKELVGNFKNSGKEWRPKNNPRKVKVHDFPDKNMKKGIPYGVYDLAADEGWVSVGTDHDTAEFAVETIARWWRHMGSLQYADAQEILIISDAGGSNGNRSRLWKTSLQKFSDTTGLKVSVCHFPPGTSKWNKIEHRMFCHITKNWSGQSLESHEVMVKLIGRTKTRTGLRIKARIDRRKYPTGIKVSDDEMQALCLKRNKFHGDWNYSLLPRS